MTMLPTRSRRTAPHPTLLASGALGGALGAGAWAAQQGLDQRAFGTGYDDVELLGTAFTSCQPAARRIGWAMHLANGAAFGAVAALALQRWPQLGARRVAWGLAMAEHVSLFPLVEVVARVHPAARAGRMPWLRQRWRAFGQATWRHALLALVLGEVLHRAHRRRR